MIGHILQKADRPMFGFDAAQKVGKMFCLNLNGSVTVHSD
jgi:hypothetical protein